MRRHRLKRRYGRQHRHAPGFEPFTSWRQVMEHAAVGTPIYYWAPMNVSPSRLYDYKVKPRSLRIWPPGSRGRGRMRDADPFTADSKHLDRFYRKVGG